MNPFRMNCGRYQSRTCWKKEGGTQLFSGRRLVTTDKSRRCRRHTDGRLNGELQDFSIITSGGGGGVSFSVVQWGIDHSCDGDSFAKIQSCILWSVGGEREIAISTGPRQMGALGLKRNLKQRWKRPSHAYPDRGEIYSLLKGSRAQKNVLLQRWKP